jgi:outer membrane protein assembly factor BamA
MKKVVLIFVFLVTGFLAFGQLKDSDDKGHGKKDSLVKDTLKLPFKIAEEERLSDEDLKDKKEGTYFTGEPDLSFDPEHGFGAGGELQLFYNGKRTDPFFAYTPYRSQIDLDAFYTTKSEREFELVWDIPYIFNSKWRLRGHVTYEVDPDYLFFGTTEKTLKPLSYYPGNDSTKGIVNNASFNDYSNNQVGSIANYNTFQQEEKSIDVTMERSWFQGKFRTLIGYEFASYLSSTPLNANSLLEQQAAAGLVTGFGASQTGLVQLGLIYDTRDLEDDPSKGSFAEITNEFSNAVFGSGFNYDRIFVHYNHYQRLLPSTFKKMVFAFRLGMGYTTSGAPFYEYLDQWTSEGDIDGLGGPQTLRGYTEDRFAAPVMALANVEMRCRFLQADFIEQHLSFYAVPFFDAGGVWDALYRIGYLNNLRFSEGPALQITWNEDTVLRFNYGFSPEGSQFYFSIGQIF